MEAAKYVPRSTRTHSRIRREICLASDDLEEEQSDPYKKNNNDENFDPNQFAVKSEPPGVMKTKLKDRRSLMKRQGSSRRRRRSSARFLKIVPDEDNEEGGDGEGANYDGTSMTNLGEVYRNAIRMNAENRINASNSWNLNLIDHLDRFVAPELRYGTNGKTKERNVKATKGGTATKNSNTGSNMESTMDSTLVSGVNFTKASCTLDASVKIYSYRVDDVHLTSYKVLANLNRTDNSTTGNGKRKNSADVSNDNGGHPMNDDEESSSRGAKSRANTNPTDTLELNTGECSRCITIFNFTSNLIPIDKFFF
jgi:condensin complex subunit 2